MEWDYSGNFLSRAWTIHAAGDKWADRGGRRFVFPFTAQPQEELRAASGRAGAAIGASRASRTPECGTLCCRQWGMELCSMRGGALLLFFSCAGRAQRHIRIEVGTAH